jgi:rhodanese-related sulfurtransferase
MSPEGGEMTTIDRLLAEARSGLERLEPAQAAKAVERGAVLIDTRPYEQRHRDGLVPGAIIIERNVLEWRLDPTSLYRIPQLTDSLEDRLLILMCDEGYSSSLAAASLQRLGVHQVTDVIGGFQAWAACGLSVLRETGTG